MRYTAYRYGPIGRVARMSKRPLSSEVVSLKRDGGFMGSFHLQHWTRIVTHEPGIFPSRTILTSLSPLSRRSQAEADQRGDATLSNSDWRGAGGIGANLCSENRCGWANAQRRRREIFVETKTRQTHSPVRGGIVRNSFARGFEYVSRIKFHTEMLQQFPGFIPKCLFEMGREFLEEIRALNS